jgi:hypothetical protein
LFCVPNVKGIQVGKQGQDIDYALRRYFIETPTGKRAMVNGLGQIRIHEAPIGDVWASNQFAEVSAESLNSPSSTHVAKRFRVGTGGI